MLAICQTILAGQFDICIIKIPTRRSESGRYVTAVRASDKPLVRAKKSGVS